jgi:hypothetical protein
VLLWRLPGWTRPVLSAVLFGAIMAAYDAPLFMVVGVGVLAFFVTNPYWGP